MSAVNPVVVLHVSGVLATQLVMSSSTADPYCPTGQASQAVALENGFKVGFAMNVPGGQHPKRPVEVKSLCGDKTCHWPPHNVRVKPLPENTVQERVEQRKERQQGVSRIFKKNTTAE